MKSKTKFLIICIFVICILVAIFIGACIEHLTITGGGISESSPNKQWLASIMLEKKGIFNTKTIRITLMKRADNMNTFLNLDDSTIFEYETHIHTFSIRDASMIEWHGNNSFIIYLNCYDGNKVANSKFSYNLRNKTFQLNGFLE